MSPFRSSAGPATVRRPTPSSSRMIVARRRLAEPRRADEQDVVERLAAAARGLERDLELLLRALLADELVELPRAKRLLDLLVALPEHGGEELAGHAALRSGEPDALLGGKLRVDPGERLLGLRKREPELDERIPRGDMSVPGAAGGHRQRDHVVRADLLLQLEHDALGRLLADPGNRLEPGGVLERRSRAGARRATRSRRRASATFGPIPLTPMRWTKSSRSAASANPYSWSASSRTWRYVSTMTSRAPSALRSADGVAART